MVYECVFGEVWHKYKKNVSHCSITPRAAEPPRGSGSWSLAPVIFPSPQHPLTTSLFADKTNQHIRHLSPQKQGWKVLFLGTDEKDIFSEGVSVLKHMWAGRQNRIFWGYCVHQISHPSGVERKFHLCSPRSRKAKVVSRNSSLALYLICPSHGGLKVPCDNSEALERWLV